MGLKIAPSLILFCPEYTEVLPPSSWALDPGQHGCIVKFCRKEIKGRLVKLFKSLTSRHDRYIVYDVAQINIKYLLKVEFKYKYGF